MGRSVGGDRTGGDRDADDVTRERYEAAVRPYLEHLGLVTPLDDRDDDDDEYDGREEEEEDE